MTARLARLVRYPVKGFGGQDLDSATVAPGAGLRHDRALAIANGSLALDPQWTRCQAFVRLTKNTDLPTYRTDVANHSGVPDASDAEVTITGPRGGSISVRLDDPDLTSADAAVTDWFGPGHRLVMAGQGLWDQRDAVLSLINLGTLGELAAVTGASVDPLRFRGNLYLSGLRPWAELSLVGRRVRIGDAELEILRPIKRCRATAVDPTDANTDLNLPATLAVTHGHLFCGVYARVVRAGSLDIGADLVDLGAIELSTEDMGTVADGVRVATVARRVLESPTALSVWLRDSHAGLRPRPRAGHHLRIHTADANGPLWRSYTVSGVDGDLIRITVRLAGPDARMSPLLHGIDDAAELIISGPHGDPIVGGDPLLLASGGIGITPTASVLRELADSDSTTPVTVVHVARTESDVALWPEVESLVNALPNAHAELFLTQPESTGRHQIGRPTKQDWSRLAGDGRVVAHLCGPIGFLRDVRDDLLAVGVTAERVHTEVFTSPGAGAGESVPPPLPGPFRVHFTASDTTVVWTRSDGSLLDVAENAGLALPSSCRAGACGSCAKPVDAGATAYTTTPVLPPTSPSVLLCCAVPTTDVTVNA